MALEGGAALPVTTGGSGKTEGGAAVPVYVVSGGPVTGGRARRVVVVTSGPVEGGAAMPVYDAGANALYTDEPALPVFVVAGGTLGVSAPVNTGLPVISGTLNLGQTLSTTDGTWTNSPTSYTYQWKRGGVNIGGATANMYTTVLADVGQTITVEVTATNAAGSVAATSAGVVIFTPTSISGLQAWFKADALALANNDPVASWTDSSGNARHATQATGANRPLYKTSQVNSLPAVDFDGSNDSLKTATFALAQPNTYFLVVRQDTWASKRLIDGFTASNNYIRQTGTTPNIQATSSGAGPATTGLAVGAWGLVTVVYNGASSTIAVNAAADTSGNTGTGNPAGVTLGDGGGGGVACDMTLAEVLVYNSVLSAPNQALVKAYLNAKYALF